MSWLGVDNERLRSELQFPWASANSVRVEPATGSCRPQGAPGRTLERKLPGRSISGHHGSRREQG